MGFGDEVRNKSQEAVGKVKEEVGDVTDNESLEAKGKMEQMEARTRDAVDDAKEGVAGAFNDAVDSTRDRDHH